MTIVSHSYISAKWHLDKGIASTWKSAKVAAVNKAIGHVDYIQHRPGVDREQQGREFFDAQDDRIDGKDVRKLVREESKDRNIVAHKLMLSPDINVPDLKQFTREVMQQLANEKGLDLTWTAVEHRNTNHPHVHIVLMAKDLNGREVRLTKLDHDRIEKNADRILDRDYPWPRQLAQREREARQQEVRQLEAERELDKFWFRELPWMEQQVVKELYQPYAERKKDADQRRQARKEFAEQPITLFDKEYSNNSSLEELQDAEKLLYRRGSKRLSVQDYKKFRSWKSDKELEANGHHAHPDPDKFEFQGTTYSKDTPTGELRAVRKFISETKQNRDPDNMMRLHSEDEAKLDEWLDDKHRAQAAGRPDEAMKQALTRQSNQEKQYAVVAEIFTQQQTMSENPVLALFADSETVDPREQADRNKREQLRAADKQIAGSLDNYRMTGKSDNDTSPEREQSFKRLKLSRQTIGRYMNKQTADEKLRKRLEIDKAHERELDDWDFDDEW